MRKYFFGISLTWRRTHKVLLHVRGLVSVDLANNCLIQQLFLLERQSISAEAYGFLKNLPRLFLCFFGAFRTFYVHSGSGVVELVWSGDVAAIDLSSVSALDLKAWISSCLKYWKRGSRAVAIVIKTWSLVHCKFYSGQLLTLWLSVWALRTFLSSTAAHCWRGAE